MKLKLISHQLLLIVPSLLLLCSLTAESNSHLLDADNQLHQSGISSTYLLRNKRQVTRGPRPTINIQVDSADTAQPLNQAVSAGAMSVANAADTAAANAPTSPVANKPAGNVNTNIVPVNNRPTRPPPVEEPEEPERRPARRRKPVRKQRPQVPQRERYDDRDDCDDDDDDHHDSDYFDYSDVMAPMRHVGRLMNNVFNQMRSTMRQAGADEEENFQPGRGNMASASAFSSSDGDSRLSSFVSSGNGRRGIITETRNGRTQTRRFGDRNEEEVDAEEES